MTEISSDIVLRAQEGDEAATRAVIEAFQGPVLSTVSRFLGVRHRGEVEDIAEEVFLKIFRSIRHFDGANGSFTAWVYSVVRDYCFEMLKRRATAPSQHPRERYEHANSKGGDLQPHQDFDNLELCRRIEEALGTLSEDQRMAFVLREYERLGYAEIASITGVHEGVVKSRLARAKASLHQQLRPYLESDA
ncbi:MAG: hypothetical protein CMJ88_09200 [Planctomycetes bacterium]|nr:hypothetical protein [Planctomycetota bacterium]